MIDVRRDGVVAVLLFCEDDLSIQRLIQASLRTSEHTMLLAGDGVQGLALAEKTRPDIIFVDVHMPRMGGLELCRTLKARSEFSEIPIVVITASVQTSEIANVHSVGADMVLAKPFRPAQLKSIVEQFLTANRTRG